MRSFCIFIISLFCITSFAQNNRKFSIEELKEDFQLLKKSFDTYNPALGVFHPKESYVKVYDSLMNTLNQPMTDLEFYPKVMRLAETTKEGHTLIGIATDTVTNIYKGFYNGSFKYLPLSFRLLKGETYLWGNFSSDSTLKRGYEILKINGQSVGHLINYLHQFAITDGDIKPAKKLMIMDNFARYYYWFIDQPEVFSIEYRKDKDATTESVEIGAINRTEMVEWRDKRYGKPDVQETTIKNIYEFEVNDNIATLTLKTFNRQLKERFKVNTKKLYKEIFTRLRNEKIEHLIIDVRDNTGGRREYAWDLLPYLMKKPLNGSVYKDVSWKGKETNNKFPKQSKSYFMGEIYVLANAKSFSNGSVVTMYAKEFGEAVVIGQETASRYGGFAAGSRQYVTLPNTRILVRIPRYIFLQNKDNLKHLTNNRGVIPDYQIEYTMEDLTNKKDLEMEKVMELIGK